MLMFIYSIVYLAFIFNKAKAFEIITTGYTQADSDQACQSVYGTRLASIHTADDEDEITTLCNTNSGYCWIGGVLVNDTTCEWAWIDDSPWDYSVTWNTGEGCVGFATPYTCHYDFLTTMSDCSGSGAELFEPICKSPMTEELVLTINADASVPFNVGSSSFNEKFWNSEGILKRICSDCDETHKLIYYQRLTLKKSFDMYYNAYDTWSNTSNLLDTDFKMYGSLTDLLSGSSVWAVCDYNDAGVAAFRNCGRSSVIGCNFISTDNTRYEGCRKTGSIYILSKPFYYWNNVSTPILPYNIDGFKGATGYSSTRNVIWILHLNNLFSFSLENSTITDHPGTLSTTTGDTASFGRAQYYTQIGSIIYLGLRNSGSPYNGYIHIFNVDTMEFTEKFASIPSATSAEYICLSHIKDGTDDYLSMLYYGSTIDILNLGSMIWLNGTEKPLNGPTWRGESGCITANNRLWSIGGWSGSFEMANVEYLDVSDFVNIGGRDWTISDDLPIGLTYAVAVLNAYTDEIFVFHHWPGFNMSIIDSVTGATRLGGLLAVEEPKAFIAVNSRVYLFGGRYSWKGYQYVDIGPPPPTASPTSVPTTSPTFDIDTLASCIDNSQIDAWYGGDSIDIGNDLWLDKSGNNHHGIITNNVDIGVFDGSNSSHELYTAFNQPIVYGSTATKILFNVSLHPVNHTVFNLCKYRAFDGAVKARILQSDTVSDDGWFGFWGEKSGTAWEDGQWITSSTTDMFNTKWVLSTQQYNLYRGNFVDLSFDYNSNPVGFSVSFFFRILLKIDIN